MPLMQYLPRARAFVRDVAKRARKSTTKAGFARVALIAKNGGVTMKTNDNTSVKDIDPALDDFFNDSFLLMVYQQRASLPEPFQELQQWLDIIANKDGDDRARAVSAVKIGEFLRDLDPYDQFRWLSSPLDWFQFALKKGSVIGAWESAKYVLARDEVSVLFSLDLGARPVVIDDTDGEALTEISLYAIEQWHQGVLMLGVRVVKSVDNWEKRDYECALACITSYLVFVASRCNLRAVYSNWTLREAVNRRKSYMKWIRPIWRLVIDKAARHSHINDEMHMKLLAQQEMICTWIEGLDPDDLATAQAGPWNRD